MDEKLKVLRIAFKWRELGSEDISIFDTMGGQVEGQVFADTGARTPKGGSGIKSCFSSHLKYNVFIRDVSIIKSIDHKNYLLLYLRALSP